MEYIFNICTPCCVLVYNCDKNGYFDRQSLNFYSHKFTLWKQILSQSRSEYVILVQES